MRMLTPQSHIPRSLTRLSTATKPTAPAAHPTPALPRLVVSMQRPLLAVNTSCTASSILRGLAIAARPGGGGEAERERSKGEGEGGRGLVCSTGHAFWCRVPGASWPGVAAARPAASTRLAVVTVFLDGPLAPFSFPGGRAQLARAWRDAFKVWFAVFCVNSVGVFEGLLHGDSARSET